MILPALAGSLTRELALGGEGASMGAHSSARRLAMSAKKNTVTTPLHLLQNLSHSLLEHLENACTGALVDAEKLLAKLEKQRGKGQDLLHRARAKLQDSAVAGKVKAQVKARDLISDLEGLLDGLQERQTETRAYIAQLKRDAQESLKLAQGIGKVKEAVTKVLDARSYKATAVPARPAAKVATKAVSMPAVKAAPAKPAARKAPAKTAAAKPVATAVANKPAAKPAAKAAVKPVAKAPVKAAAKPAAKAPAKPAAAAVSANNGVTAPVSSAS
jgi:hypothetical protein